MFSTIYPSKLMQPPISTLFFSAIADLVHHRQLHHQPFFQGKIHPTLLLMTYLVLVHQPQLLPNRQKTSQKQRDNLILITTMT
ncbi:hypothetical protein BRADI_4g17170v3 [Brachypodium distachyon]|uniref:Uncharacterized protein n=1 Tax=Brachypodium distachyon TaxID=15368 RepID=A0A0Q3EL70_BRADI|nr:hypothetical protein BRADI_4g17170v3 [Brachypodium distachyon]